MLHNFFCHYTTPCIYELTPLSLPVIDSNAATEQYYTLAEFAMLAGVLALQIMAVRGWFDSVPQEQAALNKKVEDMA
jgi:hypothetical protein